MSCDVCFRGMSGQTQLQYPVIITPKPRRAYRPAGFRECRSQANGAFVLFAEKVLARRPGYPKSLEPRRPCDPPRVTPRPDMPGLSSAFAGRKGKGMSADHSATAVMAILPRTRFSQVVQLSVLNAVLKRRFCSFKRTRAALRRTACLGPEGSFS